MPHQYKYLFGPVPSRRLGLSLGLDLTPYKTCTLDCVFCQLGRTTRRTIQRRAYVPLRAIQTELLHWIKKGGRADCITLCGSGEPTLHTGFGEMLAFVREQTSWPTVLMTNGTLFTRPAVRRATRRAHIVKVSLSAWDQTSFMRINRPQQALSFERIVEGYRALRAEFSGQLWLEVFLLQGWNATPANVSKIAGLAASFQPDVIHLNTAARPTATAKARPLATQKMLALASLFQPPAQVIAEFPARATVASSLHEAAILALLRRRPCTAQQISAAFGTHPNEVAKHLEKLTRANASRRRLKNQAAYYVALKRDGD